MAREATTPRRRGKDYSRDMYLVCRSRSAGSPVRFSLDRDVAPGGVACVCSSTTEDDLFHVEGRSRKPWQVTISSGVLVGC